MKTITVAFLFLLISAHVSGQTWRRTYGGNGSDAARSVKPTLDGGFVVVGSTGSFGVGGDGYLLKLDVAGEVEWSNFYGDAQVDEIWDVLIVDDGYLMIGVTSGPGLGGYDGLVIRIDEQGAQLWRRTYGTPEWDFLYAAELASDGFFLVGSTFADASNNGDGWVLRINNEGDVMWEATFGEAFPDEARAIHLTADDGCLVAGSTGREDGTSDIILLRYSFDGSPDWQSVLTLEGDERAYGVDVTTNGMAVVVGHSIQIGSFKQIFLAGFSLLGLQGWTRQIGEFPEWEGWDVVARSDGGLAVAGSTTAFGFGGKDMYLLLTDEEGFYQFGTTFGGLEDETANSLVQTADGGFILAGHSDSYGPGPRSFFVVRTGANGLTETEQVNQFFDPVSVPMSLSIPALSLFPNPVLPTGMVSVPGDQSGTSIYTIFDVQGQMVAQGTVGMDGRITLGLLSPGLYTVTLSGLPTRYRMVVAY